MRVYRRTLHCAVSLNAARGQDTEYLDEPSPGICSKKIVTAVPPSRANSSRARQSLDGLSRNLIPQLLPALLEKKPPLKSRIGQYGSMHPGTVCCCYAGCLWQCTHHSREPSIFRLPRSDVFWAHAGERYRRSLFQGGKQCLCNSIPQHYVVQPERSFTQMRTYKIRREEKPSVDFGERVEAAALHTLLLQLYNLQGEKVA